MDDVAYCETVWVSGGFGDAGGGWSGGVVPGGAGAGKGGDGVNGRRTKKLLVAFQFQFSNQAGWKCDDCRRSGLEKKRRCGWLTGSESGKGGLVWARKDVALETCPKSYITAESLALVEEFFVRRRLHGIEFSTLSARQVEAFLILEQALTSEINDGQHTR